jgi:hypothetical protein
VTDVHAAGGRLFYEHCAQGDCVRGWIISINRLLGDKLFSVNITWAFWKEGGNEPVKYQKVTNDDNQVSCSSSKPWTIITADGTTPQDYDPNDFTNQAADKRHLWLAVCKGVYPP